MVCVCVVYSVMLVKGLNSAVEILWFVMNVLRAE